MQQMRLTDDDVFERQQIRKRASAKSPVAPVAIVPDAPHCGACLFWRRAANPEGFGRCRQVVVLLRRDRKIIAADDLAKVDGTDWEPLRTKANFACRDFSSGE
jgi:hypothetical protein